MTRTSFTKGMASPRRRELLLTGGLLVLVVVGLFGLAAATGWQETLDQLARLSLPQIGVLLLLSLANYVLRGTRWHMFARRLGLATRYVQNLRHFLGGFAMSATPGRVGELIRMRWIQRETGTGFAISAPLVLVDRASDLAATALILAVALAFTSTGLAGAAPVVIVALLLAYVATRPTLLRALADLGFRLVRRWPRLFARIRAAARALAAFSRPEVLIVAALVGAIGWVAEGYAFYLLLYWMGSDIGLANAIAVFIFSTLAGGLTGAPGGVGGAEAAMVALLSLQGVPLEVSVPATAVIRLTTLWFAIAIGMAIFPVAERHSLKAKNALEAN